MAGPVRIAILANASQAKKEFKSVGREAETFGDKFKRFGKKAGKVAGVGLAVAGAAAIKFGSDSVKAASDAEQSMGATETVFGKFADSVVKNSDRAAEKYGLSANTYRENANLIGSLFKNQGVAMDELGSKTDDMIGTAADLAATFGGDTSEAVAALGSAFKGEFDPLEKYGISMKQSDVNARLAAKGQDKLTGKARKTAEQIAKSELINEQAAQTQGAFAKESDTLAGKQQRLAAKFENLKAKIGQKLLPVLVALGDWVLKKGLPAIENFWESLQPLIDRVVDFFKSFKGSGEAQGRVKKFLDFCRDAFESVKQIIEDVVTIVRELWSKFGEDIVAYATAAFDNLLQVLDGIIDFISGWVQIIKGVFTGDWQAVWDGVKKVFRAVWTKIIPGILKQAWNIIKTLLKVGGEVANGILRGAWGLIKSATRKAWDWVKDKIGDAWDKIKSTVKTKAGEVVDWVKGLPGRLVKAVGNLGSLLKSKGRDLINGLWNGLKDKFTEAKMWVSGLPGKVKIALGDLSSLLSGIGWDIINGLWQGMKNAWNDVKGWLSSKAGEIKDLKGPPAKDKRILIENGKFVMQGFLKGLRNGWDNVSKYLGRVTQYVKAKLDKRFDGRTLRLYTRSVLRSLRSERRAIRKNERQQNRLNKRLEKAKKLLADRLKAQKDYAKSVKDSVVGTGNVTSLETGHMNSVGNLIGQLRQRVADAKRYAALIAQLTKDGLNKTSLQQIIDAGVQGGLSTAEAIAAGGKSAISEINDLTKQLTATGKGLGDSTSKTMLQAGVDAAKGLVKGLNKQANQLTKAANRLAKQLVKAVKRALGIKSPSRVFKGIGDNVTEGLVVGLDDYRVKKAGQALAGSLTDGFGTPALDAYSASVKSSNESKVKVTLTSEQVSQLQRGREIQMDLDAYKSAGGRARAS